MYLHTGGECQSVKGTELSEKGLDQMICVMVAALVNAPPPPGVDAASDAPAGKWQLGNVAFLSGNGVEGHMCLDTGCERTTVTSGHVKKAGLKTRPLPPDIARRLVVKGAGGQLLKPLGVTDMDVSVQLILETEGGVCTHWDRRFRLQNVLVVEADDAPRDLYVSFQD